MRRRAMTPMQTGLDKAHSASPPIGDQRHSSLRDLRLTAFAIARIKEWVRRERFGRRLRSRTGEARSWMWGVRGRDRESRR